MNPSPLLSVEDVHLRFGGIKALGGVSLQAKAGEITAVIGPNGAGKTSLFNTISGFYKPQQGRIQLEGRDITPTKPNVRAALQAMAYWGQSQREELALREEIERDVIDFLEIDHVRHQSVASLSYGLQKRVELARALAMRPKILMLDEPVAGMNREETEDMARFILDLQEERGMTILLIEHDMGMVMDISNHVAVLNFGQLIASGTPQHVRNHPDVIEAYLGVRESQTAPGQGA